MQAYLREPNASAAARAAGYQHPGAGYSVLRGQAVQKALHDARQRLIATEGATIAYNTLIDLMRPANPANVRLGAAKYLMDAAGHGAKDAPGEAKGLTEMSADELVATIAKLDRAMATKADGAIPAPKAVIEGQSLHIAAPDTNPDGGQPL